MIQTSLIPYHHAEQSLEGYLAYNNATSDKRPAVLVVHDWSGRNAFACQKADAFADMGYVGFAVDLYGDAAIGETTAEKQALMTPLMHDRGLLLARITAAFNTVSALPFVDTTRIAIIGFCFGGLCALDLVRSGAKLVGAVSFHGLLHKPPLTTTKDIKARLLILHGYDDPMISSQDITDFCDEMSEAHADWQFNIYSQTQHAFMNPAAQDTALGTVYQPRTAERAWKTMQDFLKHCFETSKPYIKLS